MSKASRAKRVAEKRPPPSRGPKIAALLALGVLIIAAGLWGWHARIRPTEGPDILLISIDTLRPDHLGCYGYTAIRTPNIDRLAAGGVVFDAAGCPVPITLPSHASMLTGLLPPRHGVRLNVGYRLPDAVLTLAEVLRDQGYQTGAFIGGLPMAKVGGLDQGFDVYDDRLTALSLGDSGMKTRQERFAEDVCAAARQWLRSTDPARPVFVFVHLYDPHAPYIKAPPGSPTPSYDGEIAYVDRTLGAFLSSLDSETRWRGMLTLLTSDHGEGLGEHREKTHGVFVYESTLRVPLIIHWPRVLSPCRIPVAVNVVDTAPTILGLAQAPALPDVDGRSLVRLMKPPGSDEGERVFYFESLLGALDYGWAPLRGIRSGNLKYVSAPRPELYDLGVDPHELNNLHAARPGDAARLAAHLSVIGEGERATVAVDAQTRAGLEALGYVSAPPVASDARTERQDPKDCIEVYDQFQLAHSEAALGRLGAALAIVEPLEPALQYSPYFYHRWGTFAAQTGDWQRAVLAYEKCLALDPGREMSRLNLGVAYLNCNDPQKSLEQFETLLQINPNHLQALLYAGQVNARYFGRPAEALTHWKRFLELAPNDPQAGAIRQAVSELTDE